VVALEKSKQEKEAQGEIESENPGYLGAQDTYYVGTIKGVGRIYQQTFIDTYSKVVFVKLYDRKNALVAADLLNDRVLPFFEQQEVPLLRVLTDRGTEYCGSLQHHEYQLYLAIENIDHTKTKARHRRLMASVSAFTAPFRMSSMPLPFARKSTLPWRSYKPIWMSGSSSTIVSVPTPGSIALGARLCRPSVKPNTWHMPSNWIRSLNNQTSC
jgi:hypothetical protein